MTISLTDSEKEKFSRWVAENVDERIVPNDEGNEYGLIYNLISLINGKDDKFSYREEQYELIKQYGVDVW